MLQPSGPVRLALFLPGALETLRLNEAGRAEPEVKLANIRGAFRLGRQVRSGRCASALPFPQVPLLWVGVGVGVGMHACGRCVYACMHVWSCVYVWGCMCVNVWGYMHMCLCISVYVCVYVYVCVGGYMCVYVTMILVYVWGHVCMCMYMCLCMCMYTVCVCVCICVCVGAYVYQYVGGWVGGWVGLLRLVSSPAPDGAETCLPPSPPSCLSFW